MASCQILAAYPVSQNVFYMDKSRRIHVFADLCEDRNDPDEPDEGTDWRYAESEHEDYDEGFHDIT